MTTSTPPLSFTSEYAFLAAFPSARKYQKANDPRFPVFAIELAVSIWVKKPWGPSGAIIDVECPADTHVLLVNTAAGECYPCAVRGPLSRDPVGYVPSAHQSALGLLAYDSAPVWAVSLREAAAIQTFEGVHAAPAGAWLCFSESKGLYHVRPEKWEQMGYAPEPV